MRLSGQVALVTGSGQGIGREISVRFAREGAKVIIEDLHADDDSEHTLELVRAEGAEGCVLAGDVSDVADIRRVVAEGVSRMGQIDVLVNNAGISRFAPFLDVTEEDYDAVLDVNLKGAFFATQAVVRHLRETHRAGRIINISSVHEELPFPNFTAYCASKGGMKMLTRNLATELGPLGITINNIAPGAIRTPMNADAWDDPELLQPLIENIPLGRVGAPGDVAGAAVFLAPPDAGYITGATLVVDGGLLWDYKEERRHHA